MKTLSNPWACWALFRIRNERFLANPNDNNIVIPAAKLSAQLNWNTDKQCWSIPSYGFFI